MFTASPARRLGPALAALLWIGSPRPGAAQDIGVGFADPVVELLPVGELLGDVLSPLDLHVLLPAKDGSPLTGRVGEVKATTAAVGARS